MSMVEKKIVVWIVVVQGVANINMIKGIVKYVVVPLYVNMVRRKIIVEKAVGGQHIANTEEKKGFVRNVVVLVFVNIIG